MDTQARALAIIGDREKVASRELVNRLWPDWQRQHGTLQRAGYALAKALGVRPRREHTRRIPELLLP